MQLRLVHRNGEVKQVDVGVAGYCVQIYWPLAGWYTVYRSTGRVAGAKSWTVHPEDLTSLQQIPVPKRPRKTKGVTENGTSEHIAAPGPATKAHERPADH